MKLPNGYGSTYKLHGSRRRPWTARITVSHTEQADGTMHYKYRYLGYYETQAQALTALAHYNENPYDPESTATTFEKLYDLWSVEYFPKVSESNVKAYQGAFRLCEPIKNMRFVDIRRSHLQKIVDTCGKNYPTLRKLKVLFSSLYKYAMQNDVCTKNYAQFVDIAQYKDLNPNKIDRIPFTDDEIEILWKWSNKNEYVGVILMMIYSGVRVGELRDLKKDDVHLEDRFFYIRKAKTAAGVRIVPIAEKVLPFFEYWMKQSNSEYFITTRNNGHVEDHNFRDAYWSPVMKELGINAEHRPHDTRHTCVSLLTRQGVDERIIKKIVGHAGKGITEQVYTHINISQLVEAINTI